MPPDRASEVLETHLLNANPGYFNGEELEKSHSILDDKLTSWEAFVKNSDISHKKQSPIKYYCSRYNSTAFIDFACRFRLDPNNCMAWCSFPGPYTLRMSQSSCLTPYKLYIVSRVCDLLRVECQCHDMPGTVRVVYPCRCS